MMEHSQVDVIGINHRMNDESFSLSVRMPTQFGGKYSGTTVF